MLSPLLCLRYCSMHKDFILTVHQGTTSSQLINVETDWSIMLFLLCFTRTAKPTITLVSAPLKEKIQSHTSTNSKTEPALLSPQHTCIFLAKYYRLKIHIIASVWIFLFFHLKVQNPVFISVRAELGAMITSQKKKLSRSCLSKTQPSLPFHSEQANLLTSYPSYFKISWSI